MQLNSVYLYSNKIDVYNNVEVNDASSLAGWTTERYRKVYNRNLKVYQSVDNRIDIQVRNCDQKVKDITGTSVVFNLITREGKDLILKKDCTVVNEATGRVYVILTKDDLLTIENGFYNYSVIQEVREVIGINEYSVTSRTVMYQDSQYGAIGTIEVNGDVDGDTEQSIEVTKFEYTNPATTGYPEPAYYTSSIIDAHQGTQTASSLHTFQIYGNNYSGTVKFQGSLSEGGTPNVWTTIETLTLTQSNISYLNIVGKYNFFRVQHYPNASTAFAKFVVQQTILGYYIVSIDEPGLGYKVGDQIVIKGDKLGGASTVNDLTITVATIDSKGRILTVTSTGLSYNGVKTFVVDGNLPTIGTLDKVLYR